jgi:exopolyphosphatase/guanosine-5'-triphosphate,3'-diphosphate pyrophosphatase
VEKVVGGVPDEIVPRWEWRTFGERLAEAEPFFAALTPHQVVETDELYVLSTASTDAAKFRHELMDIKHLQEVDDNGLELWSPVMKATFPLAADEVGEVLSALGLEGREPLDRTQYSLTELLEEIVGPSPHLRGVEVRKTRRRYTIDGCMAELTEVGSEGLHTLTIAVESEDAELVLETVRRLGLAGRPNTSFARGLAALIGFGARRHAVIDVGTNSVKFHVGELGADRTWRKVVDRAEVSRLGEGLQETGRLNAEPMRRTVDAIDAMAKEAQARGATGIAAVGTAALRIASNSDEFVNAVRDRSGVEVEVISGEEESRLAYLAATSALGTRGSRVVFDTGGGSSQFTFGNGDLVEERFSVDVGAVRFAEKFALDGVVAEDALAAALRAIADDLGRLDGREPPDSVVGMGGAVTNLTAVKHGLAEYDPDVVQGTVLDLNEIDRQIDLYRTRDADGRRSIAGLQPARAEVILAGACIVRSVLGKLGKDSLTVSDRGLRHGLLAERFG